MRRLLLTTATASVIALAGCVKVDLGSSAYASRDGASLVGGDLTASLDETGDFRIAGADVTVSGSVGGVLDAAAADFTGRNLRVGALDVSAADLVFSGHVSGDAVMRAADIRWSGDIGGDADIAAADLSFDGSVSGLLDGRLADARLSGEFGALELSAADVVLTDRARVFGDVHGDVAELELDGQVDGALDIQARTVRLAGAVDGPLALYVDPGRGRIDRDDGLVEISGEAAGGYICARRVVIDGRVQGALTVLADDAPEIRAGGSAPGLDFIPRNGQRCERD